MNIYNKILEEFRQRRDDNDDIQYIILQLH